MKYYVYISDAKVDMLLPQIPQDAKRDIATEFKVDLKVFSASRRSETKSSEDRISRLEAVCSFIREFGDVGDVSNPGEYVADTLEMEMVIDKAADPPVVFFKAAGEADAQIAIGGSVQNLIGHLRNEEHDSTYQIPQLISRLLLALEKEPDEKDPVGEVVHRMRYLGPPPILKRRRKLHYEFLAKRLLYQDEKVYGGHHKMPKILIASPLYVALAE